MAKPEEYTVQAVIERAEWNGNKGPMVTYEMLLEGENATRKGHVEAGSDPHPEPGGKVSGWLNDNGKFGFASDKPKTAPAGGGSGGGRDDATGRSIERQVAAKCAAEMCAAVGTAEYMDANFDGLFDLVLGKIQGVDVKPVSGANGSEQPALGDDDIEF